MRIASRQLAVGGGEVDSEVGVNLIKPAFIRNGRRACVGASLLARGGGMRICADLTG